LYPVSSVPQLSGMRALWGVLCLFAMGCEPVSLPELQEDNESATHVTLQEETPILLSSPESHCQPRRTMEYEVERNNMVEEQIAARGIRDASVLSAMKAVPRHWFVPEELARLAYTDRPLPIGAGQTISQPYIVALMTSALGIKQGDRVLEIGTGSGYQAAVMAELTPYVWSIEIEESLARHAAMTLETHGYGCVQVRAGDGYRGWPEAAPFDAIIVTCAPPEIPKTLIEQLKAGGRMCIPVGEVYEVQDLMLVTKQADGTTKTISIEPVRFVPMTGNPQVE